ncbi:MAG: hypothetical protein ACNS62_03685 [Candidatus Cyclobacteriaceae bacterium M3_2C_046]
MNPNDRNEYRMSQFMMLLSKGSDLEIAPDQKYILKWELDAATHRAVMSFIQLVMEDEYINLVVGDVIVFYDQLKDSHIIHQHISEDVECSGLALTALTMVLFEIWSDEEYIKDKTNFNKFVEGLYTRVEELA